MTHQTGTTAHSHPSRQFILVCGPMSLQCGPCRQLVPKLSEYYERHHGAKNFEVVFVSADKSEAEFDSYFGEQPWVAVPWSGPLERLQRTLKVEGYPTLTVLDHDGKVVARDVVNDIIADPSGEQFPYRPKSLWDVLDGDVTKLRASKGGAFSKDLLHKYDYIGLYFSAHWCPPCRSFTPRLVEWYNEHAEKHNLLMLFVSADRDASSFEEYHDTMPWPAIAFDDPKKEDAYRHLSKLCSVSGIPTLAVFDKEGTLLTTEGRQLVTSRPEDFPWPPRPVNPIDAVVTKINEEPIAILFLDKMTAPDDDVRRAFENVAKPHFDRLQQDSSNKPISFATASAEDGMTDRLRQMFGMGRDPEGPTSVRVVVVDATSGLRYDMKQEGIPEEDAMKEFIDGALDGTADGVPLG